MIWYSCKARRIHGNVRLLNELHIALRMTASRSAVELKAKGRVVSCKMARNNILWQARRGRIDIKEYG